MENQTLQPNTNQFNHDQLLQALYAAWDMFDRAMVPMVLIKHTAKSAANGEPLSGEDVRIGVLKKDLTRNGLDLLQIMWKAEEMTDTRITYRIEGVPVVIEIYKKGNRSLTNPDVINYENETFFIPNSFKTYWKLRNAIL